jgi:hypothetical protein
MIDGEGKTRRKFRVEAEGKWTLQISRCGGEDNINITSKK